MENKILKFYLQFSVFTNPGCYRSFLEKLPDDVSELGTLVCHQIIHPVTLKEGNTNANRDLRYGDMEKYPWHRLRCDDDVLPTAVSMIAELYRLDERGFIKERKVEDKLVVTCRYVSLLMAASLKSKGIPCRVRSGFAPYFHSGSWDHWLNQYWNEAEKRWVTFDADAFFDASLGFDPYDIPQEKFDWAADTWLGLRRGSLKPENFINAGGYSGLLPALWELMYDFHCLMNDEIIYTQMPSYIHSKFDKLTEADFKELDELAEMMKEPDANFDKLLDIWENKRKFRIMNSPLVSDDMHVNDK